jgi:cobalt-zinc-cadmium efflux system membrane fusion protein
MPTVLVVEDDEVLLGVVSRALGRAGYVVLRAGTVAEALGLAPEAPELALLDLALPDGNGLDLARALHARRPDLPLLLMTACPLPFRERPELARLFVRVLAKPLGLGELFQAVQLALTEKDMSDSKPLSLEPTSAPATEEQRLALVPANGQPPAEGPPAPSAAPPAVPAADGPPAPRGQWLGGLVMMLLAVASLVFFFITVFELPIPYLSAAHKEKTTERPPGLHVELVEDAPNTLHVPKDVRESLGILKGKEERLAVATAPKRTRPLVLSGSTAIDPTGLMRIRARFAPAEVVRIAPTEDLEMSEKKGTTQYRELRSGDWVKKGQELAVFYSVDVGSKKNDLIDALVQLRLDLDILDRAEKSYAKGAIPEVFLLNARRAVEGDHSSIARSLNMLRTWGISDEDIKAVMDEAEQIGKRRGKRDIPSKETLDRWARVVLKAPDDGVIVERNIAKHEIVVDGTTNLFQIARVSRLAVVANAPEDDLPILLKLPTHQRVWKVKALNDKGEGVEGRIDEISYLIDPNQHSAPVKGYIDNPVVDGLPFLRGGQFVSATVQLPAPPDVVEVDMDAIVDDGKQCIVFVQTDPKKHYYQMRRVEVTHRFDKTAFVRSKLTAEQQKLTPEEKAEGLLPRQPLHLDERLLLAGVLELKKELADQKSKARKDEEKDAKDGAEGPKAKK